MWRRKKNSEGEFVTLYKEMIEYIMKGPCTFIMKIGFWQIFSIRGGVMIFVTLLNFLTALDSLILLFNVKKGTSSFPGKIHQNPISINNV